jgi:hypothetical protein
MNHKFDEELLQTRGLGLCTVCGSAESELTTHCPGWKMPVALRANVRAGVIDYKDHSWLARKSINEEWHKVSSPVLMV